MSPPPVSYGQCVVTGSAWNCAEGHYIKFEGPNGPDIACQCLLWCSDFGYVAVPGEPCGGLASNGLTCTRVRDANAITRDICIPNSAGPVWHELCGP